MTSCANEEFQDKIYEFQCLPFGLSSAPRAFTRLLKPVVAVLRSSGIRIVIYLDDLLIMHQDRQEIVKIFNMVLALLKNLGFLIKAEKCSRYPTQTLVFLGALLDSKKLTIAVPMNKLQDLQRESANVAKKKACSMHELASMIGRMNQMSRIGIHRAPLYYRALQRAYINCLHKNGRHTRSQRVQVSLNSQALAELQWWTSSEISQNNGVALHPPPIEMTIETDASTKGWGAVCRGTRTGGRWSISEAKHHINYLELKAAYLAIQAFVKEEARAPRHLKLLIDNTTAVAYINKKGGTRSPQLATLAAELWTYCSSRQIWVTAKHLPGLMNSEADHASRNFNTHTEWKLNPEIFQRITTRYYTPEVDLFASRLNHQLPLYVTRYPDPGAIATDAFLQDWSLWTVFIHPPIVLIPRILLQMKHDKATDCPELARPSLVSRPVGNVGGLPSESTSQSVNHSSSVCSRRNSPTMEDPSSSGMASFRSRIEAAGIPEDVCQIIMASWRGSTQQRYEGPWKLWSSWCIQRQKCPFSAPVNDILAFLAEQFNNRRLAYRTIAVYKACISQLHDPIEGRQVGNLPLVSRFMKGIFELRPPQPKLCSIWPVSRCYHTLPSWNLWAAFH